MLYVLCLRLVALTYHNFAILRSVQSWCQLKCKHLNQHEFKCAQDLGPNGKGPSIADQRVAPKGKVQLQFRISWRSTYIQYNSIWLSKMFKRRLWGLIKNASGGILDHGRWKFSKGAFVYRKTTPARMVFVDTGREHLVREHLVREHCSSMP